MEICAATPDMLHQAAEQFAKTMDNRTVFAFYGEMGAGKTTFIRALCRVLGVEEEVASPSFAIVNEYCTRFGSPIYHFDFYRIGKPEEACDIGCEEYFASGNLCLIEWPERIEALLPPEAVRVDITVEPGGQRRITLDA